MYFDTNRCFLLPPARRHIQSVKRLHDDNPESALLIVGHTDTTESPSDNDPLSVERAESVAAYLTDDVGAWLRRYDSGIPLRKRWGIKEDLMMIAAVTNVTTRKGDEPPLVWFQRTRALPPTGVADHATRRQLVQEYMAFDDTKLPDGVPVTTHGCGENFPLDDPIGSASTDEEATLWNRRVEIYYFDKVLGVQPQPPGSNSHPSSPEYQEWVRRALETHNFELVRSRFRARVVDAKSGVPLQGLPFQLEEPLGGSRDVQTDAEGRLAVADVSAPGTCVLRSIPAHATVATGWPVVGISRDPASSGHSGEMDRDPPSVILEIAVHTVRTGDTLRSIARNHGVSERDIEHFHCDSNKTEARHAWLHDIVGSTYIDADNEPSFDDADRPGAVQVPKPLALLLETGIDHLIRVGPVERGYANHRPPVYMRALDGGVSIRSAASPSAAEIGALPEGSNPSSNGALRFGGACEQSVDASTGVADDARRWMEQRC